MNNAPGIRKLGPYRLLRVVGGGDGTGMVYEAVGPQDPQLLAVHVLPATRALLHPDALRRLDDTVRAAAGLRHPNIVAVLESGCEDRTPFVATELVDGETLPQFLARTGRLPALQALAFAAQLLSALEHAHQHGVLHTAVQPERLLVARNGHLKVSGFGWLAAAAATAPRPGPFDAPDYLAPEVRAGGPVDAPADVYSAAVVTYELLAGRLPFDAPASPAPLPLQASRPQLPAGLDAVFMRALAPDPAQRYASAAAFGEALGAAFDRPLWVRPILVSGPPKVEVPAMPAFVARPQAEDPPAPEAASYGAGARRIALAAAIGLAACVVWLGSLLHDDLEAAPEAREPVLVESRATPAASRDQVAKAPAPQPVQPANLAPPPVVTPPPNAPVTSASPVPAPQRPAEPVPPATRSMGAGPAVAEAEEEERPAARRVARAQETAPRRPSGREVRSAHVAPVLDCVPHGMAGEFCRVMRCATAEFRRHPVCVRLHAEGRARHDLSEARVAP